MTQVQPDYKRAGITHGPVGNKEWYALFECPTDGCEAQHEFLNAKIVCGNCDAVIKPEVVAKIVKPAERERSTTEETDDGNLGGFDEPFEVPDHFATQTVV